MKRNNSLIARLPSILSILVILVILVGCNRNKTTDEKKIYSDSLNGEWELREVHGGMIARPSPYYSPGNGNIWQFEDSSFKRFAAGQLINSGVVTFGRDTCPATQTILDAFILPDSYGYRLFFEISKDTMTLYNGVIAADGTIEKYVRINSSNF